MDETSAIVAPHKLSIIVVTCDSADALCASLPSWRVALERFNDRGAWEIIVVDNASADSSGQLLADFSPEVRVISSAENLGFAAGCNLGAGEAKGEILLFLNPDVILDPEALTELESALCALENAGAVCGRMRNPDGTFQSNCRNLPTAVNILASRGSVVGRLFPSRQYTLPDSPRPIAVPAAAATCLALKRDFFEALGGFDERFFMYFEDTDLSLRVGRAGKSIYFIPTAGGVHHWGAGSRATRFRRARWHHRSTLEYFRKHHPGIFTSAVLPLALGCNLLFKALANLFRGA